MSPPRLTYMLFLVGALLWCTAIMLPPLLISSGGGESVAGILLYRVFSPLCHQMEDRCLSLAGHPMAVCARCAAIYVGFLLGLLIYPALRSVDRPVLPPRWFVLAALVPVVLDAASGALGLHAVSVSTRLATGIPCGLVLSFVVLPAALQAACEFASRKSPVTSHVQKGTSHA